MTSFCYNGYANMTYEILLWNNTMIRQIRGYSNERIPQDSPICSVGTEPFGTTFRTKAKLFRS